MKNCFYLKLQIALYYLPFGYINSMKIELVKVAIKQIICVSKI